MTPKKLFLFDLDGTLVTTGGAGLRALARTFEELYQISDILSTVNPQGKTDPAIFREVITTYLSRDPKSGELDEISNHYLTHLKMEVSVSSALRVFVGVEEFLGYLSTRKDIVVGLGTGNLERGARIKLGPTRLNGYFPFGGFGSDAEDRAEVLRMGHRRAEAHLRDSIEPGSVYIIGDTTLDIKAARTAGFKAIAVATGGVSFQDLEKAKPDYLMRDMREGFEFMNQLDSTELEMKP